MNQNQRGFTLIEVLLASFIFMSVVTIAIGSFTSQITLQSSTEAQRNVQQTAQGIIEAISRDIRTYDAQFDLSGPCPIANPLGGDCGDSISIGTPPNNKDYKRLGSNGSEIRLCNPACAAENVLNDTSKVIVTDFYAEGLEPEGDPLDQRVQPFVIIHLSLETVGTGRQEEFAELTLRTMVTSRLFDKYRP